MSIPRLQGLDEEHLLESLAQICTVVKYSREGHAQYTQTVLDYLNRQGSFKE
jgi:hypothetical protein